MYLSIYILYLLAHGPLQRLVLFAQGLAVYIFTYIDRYS